MEGASICAVLQVMFEKVTSPILKECSLLWGVNKELQKLRCILSALRSVLEDSDECQPIDRATKNWLEKLRDVAYKVDDIVDELTAEGRYGRSHTFKTKVCKFFSSDNPRFYRLTMKNRIKRVRERLDEVAEERYKFHLGEGVVRKKIGMEEIHETHSFVYRSKVYGKEGERDKIMDLLISADGFEDVPVVSIVGNLGSEG